MSDNISYRINEIRVDLNEDKAIIPDKIRRRTGIRNLEIYSWKIARESIDARRKPDVKLVYTVDFLCDRIDIEKKSRVKLTRTPVYSYEIPVPIKKPERRPAIIGSGPCGIFAAYTLAKAGLKPIIIERGSCMEKRIRSVERFWREGVLDTECNVQFGEGGAGTFSDGKLTTGIRDKRTAYVLKTFVRAGADNDILYKHRPHIGTDVIRGVIVSLRKNIENMGGTFLFDTRLSGIKKTRDRVSSIVLNEDKTIETDHVILAPGHSARDTFRMLCKSGMKMRLKAFSIGVRIEHPQKLIDEAQYGDAKIAEKIGAADYKLNYRCSDGRGVYTFCMCPGGEVITASSQKNCVVTNGMSLHARSSGKANSGLLVDVRISDFASDHPLGGIEFQEKYEQLAFINGGSGYKAPECTLKEFKDTDEKAEKVINSLPPFAVRSIREAIPHLAAKLKGFDYDYAIIKAVESRSSSPVRIERNEFFESPVGGLYPAGEGAGYAGGIISAAVDGMKVAEAIISASG